MNNKILILLVSLSFAIASCGGGSGGGGSSSNGLDSANFACDGACPRQSLSAEEVRLLLRQAIAASESLGVASNIAVMDRVGNVLALYAMSGAPGNTIIDGQIGARGGLEGVSVPASAAASSKAGTGAFLSSQGNAFTTRTASQIIQENFNPGERNQPGGPLFGVQLSQLICSDVTVLNSSLVGPKPLPLGLSADPGGIPLYKQGDVVGGIGIELDGRYTLDRDVSDFDDDIEERIALAASRGFEAPSERTGDTIFVLGKSFRYTDLGYSDLDSLPEQLPEINESNLLSFAGFSAGTIKAGATFGTPSSGVLETSRIGIPAAVLVDESGTQRFQSINGTSQGGLELSATEVEAILDSVFLTAFRSRAAIRRPRDTPARVSIWVVDSQGVPLGFVRSQDAPLFGIDVSLQKARTAVFFSSSDAGDLLERAGLGSYVSATRALLGPGALTGSHAFADRSGGNLSRPFFPDGINGNANGPLSHPFPSADITSGPTWSPFNTGLQLDLIFTNLVAPLSGVIPNDCASGVFNRRLNNGIQIFPGSVPLYRNGVLIGGIGVSGDGIDQDDLFAFYGASRRGLDAVGHTTVGDPVLGFNAPKEIRADNISVEGFGLNLRYVNCPEAPFIGSDAQNACDGL